MKRIVGGAVLAALVAAGCGSSGEGEGDGGDRPAAGQDRPQETLATAPPEAGTETGATDAGEAAAPSDDAAALPPARGDETVPVSNVAVRIDRRTQLRSAPDGRVVATLGRRTQFRSRQVVAVVARRGDWLGVLHPAVANGRRAGWIPVDAGAPLRRRYRIVVSRSKLRATLLRDDKPVQSFRIGVGRPGNPTPTGRFAVTDRLLTGDPSGPYGRHIVAITARQPDLPQGWTGGDRVAFHGGPERRVGVRTTSGCMTVRNRELAQLFRRVQLGTRVDVRA